MKVKEPAEQTVSERSRLREVCVCRSRNKCMGLTEPRGMSFKYLQVFPVGKDLALWLHPMAPKGAARAKG